jgi:hypothetical protein
MTGRHPTLRLALLVVLALCAAAWFFIVPERAVTTAAQAPSSAIPTPPPSPVPPTVPSAPLPPADTPLPLVFKSLQARADAGDPKSACRLGIELLRCQTLETFGRITTSRLAFEEREATERGDLAQADERARTHLHHLAVAKECARLPPGVIEQGPRYLRQAALAGEPEAMLRYAAGQGFEPLKWHAFLRSPDLDAWRREAPAMVERSLASGRPEAAYLLWSAYADGESRLSGLIPDDPIQARAHRLLMERLWDTGQTPGPPAQDAPALSPAQEQQAASLASEWHLRHFKAARFDADHVLDGIAPFHDTEGTGGSFRTDLAFCESSPGVPRG